MFSLILPKHSVNRDVLRFLKHSLKFELVQLWPMLHCFFTQAALVLLPTPHCCLTTSEDRRESRPYEWSLVISPMPCVSPQPVSFSLWVIAYRRIKRGLETCHQLMPTIKKNPFRWKILCRNESLLECVYCEWVCLPVLKQVDGFELFLFITSLEVRPVEYDVPAVLCCSVICTGTVWLYLVVPLLCCILEEGFYPRQKTLSFVHALLFSCTCGVPPCCCAWIGALCFFLIMK